MRHARDSTANDGYVNTARFLLLLAALTGLASAQGCSDSEGGGDGASSGASGDGSQAHAGAASGAGAGSGPTDQGGSGGAAGSSSAGGMADGAGRGGTREAGSSGAAGSPDGGAGGSGGATDPGGAGGAGACNDDVGEPSCDGVTTACAPFCAAALTNAKKAVAVDAIACLKLDFSQGCGTGYDCLAAATALGCSEDVATACEIAAQNCQTTVPGKPGCAQLLSGLNDEGRSEMLLCLEQYCDSVWACAQNQFFESPP